METNNKPTLYWSLLTFKDLNFYIASTLKGLVFVGSPNKPFEELSEWAKKRFRRKSFVGSMLKSLSPMRLKSPIFRRKTENLYCSI